MRSDVLNPNSNAHDASVGGFEFINATKTLTQADSGKVFALNSTSAVTVTLPTDANCSIGCHYKFIVQTTNDNAYTISTGDNADSGGDDFVGGMAHLSTTAGFGHAVVAAANDNTIIFDANLDDTGGLVGSWVEITKLASNQWMIDGATYASDTDSSGAGTLTNAD